MALDYYKVLGIGRGADDKEIKSAYRKLARKYHPDVNPNDAEAERKFKEIGEAYSVIGNPEKRKLYDKFGSNWEQASQFGGGGGPASEGEERVNFGGEGFESLFEQFFQNFGGGDVGFGRGGAVVPPQDIEQTIELSLEEIDEGSRRRLSYRSPDACRTCDGRGVVELTGKRSASCPNCGGQRTVYQDRKVEVSIPAGIENGKKLRVPGGGVRGTKGRAGDLFVIVRESPHPKFKRKGADLEVEIEVDYLTAALGGSVHVPTLKSSGTMQIPTGTPSGQALRLKGKGLTKLGSSLKGDLFARIKITVPKQLEKEERKLLEQIQKSRGEK